LKNSIIGGIDWHAVLGYLSRGNNPLTVPTKEAEAKAVKDEGQNGRQESKVAPSLTKGKRQKTKAPFLIYP